MFTGQLVNDLVYDTTLSVVILPHTVMQLETMATTVSGGMNSTVDTYADAALRISTVIKS